MKFYTQAGKVYSSPLHDPEIIQSLADATGMPIHTIEEYCREGEHQDGTAYWIQFPTMGDLLADLDRYLWFTQIDS